jgi:GT2 family glycosyltransferase
MEVDWVAGLFMAMRAETFETLGGFDERYFLYCEDAELCLRAWNRGFDVRVVPAAPVTHPARRQTMKNWRHFRWHLESLAKLWNSDSYRQFEAGRGKRRLRPAD